MLKCWFTLIYHIDILSFIEISVTPQKNTWWDEYGWIRATSAKKAAQLGGLNLDLKQKWFEPIVRASVMRSQKDTKDIVATCLYTDMNQTCTFSSAHEMAWNHAAWERERERHNFHVRINTIKYAFFVFFLICKLYTYKSYMYVIEHVFLYKKKYIFLTLCLEEPAGVQESQCRLCHGSSGIPREHQESFHGVPSVRSQWDEVETSGSRVVFEIKLPDHQWSPTNGTFQGGRWSVDFF